MRAAELGDPGTSLPLESDPGFLEELRRYGPFDPTGWTFGMTVLVY